MLDKLLGNLKKSLPESLRGKMGSEETQEEEYSEQESEESHDTSDNETPPEDKKKKQISMIIRVVVVLGLGYMAATEFIFKPEPENTEVPAVAVKRKPRRKPLKPGDKPAETKSADAAVAGDEKKPGEGGANPADANQETKPATEPVSEEIKAADKQPPVENINIADKMAAEEKVAEKAPEKTADKPVEPPKEKEQPIDETPIVKTPEENSPQVGEVKSSEGGVEKSLDSLIENMDAKEKTSEGQKKPSKLEDKIVADDVYTPPPAYDQLGRGLVYNCKDKFWACLDKTAYVACNKNMKWNKGHGKAAECAVQNVYNSDEDCSTVQKYNVSTNKPTPFCQ